MRLEEKNKKEKEYNNIITPFHGPIANSSSYPSPILPSLPVPGSNKEVLSNYSRSFTDIRNLGEWCYTTNGRSAIYLSLLLLRLEPGDKILLPSYHCSALVAPLIAFGIQPIFYEVDYQLFPDLDQIRRLIPKSKAIIIVHYFGFPNSTKDIGQVFEKENIYVLEDCAHSFFISSEEENDIGSLGGMLVGSTRKFFPGEDGGVLVWRHGHPNFRSRWPGPMEELRYLVRLYGRSGRYGKGGKLGQLFYQLFGKPRQASSSPRTHYTSRKTSHPFPSDWFDSQEAWRGISLISRLQIKSGVNNTIATRRRMLFECLLNGIQDLRARPLFSALPDNVVPYVFPLLLDDPERDFDALKQAGLPILRWEEMACTECIVANDYRRRLIQLPCHQSITDKELDWMISVLHRELGQG